MAQKALLRPIGLTSRLLTQKSHIARPFSTVIDAPVHPASQQQPPLKPTSRVFEDAVQANGPRNTWTKEEISEIYNTPLIELTYASVGSLDVVPLVRN